MKKIAYLILIAICTVNLTNAEGLVKGNLSFDIGSTVSEFVKHVFKTEEKIATTTEVLNIKEEVKKVKLTTADLNTCEIYDATYLNTIDLDLASTKATEKIDKIDETIDSEMSLREEIFSNTKNLNNLQKKEKAVFKEMKNQLEGARTFYKNINEKVVDVNLFLENTDCDALAKENKAKKKTLKILGDYFDDTNSLINEEQTFRKDFTASLKDNMSVLQKDVKDLKNLKEDKKEKEEIKE